MRQRRIGLIAIGALIVLALIVIGVVFSGVGRNGIPATPTTPPYTVQTIRPAENALLNNYGWVDQKAGIARIPIDRAIEIVAARGLPSRAVSGTPIPNEGQTIPSYASSGTQGRLWSH